MNTEDFGKILISLMDGDDPICYYKAKVKDFMADKNKEDPHMKWVSFLPDQCVNKVKEPHVAGIFSFRFEIVDVTMNPDFDIRAKKVWR